MKKNWILLVSVCIGCHLAAQPVPFLRRDAFRKALETREKLRNGIVERAPESERQEPGDPNAILSSEAFSKMSPGRQRIVERSLKLDAKIGEFCVRAGKIKPEDVIKERIKFEAFEMQERQEIWRLSRALDAEELAEEQAELKRVEARLQASIAKAAKAASGTNTVVLNEQEKARIEEEKARSEVGKAR